MTAEHEDARAAEASLSTRSRLPGDYGWLRDLLGGRAWQEHPDYGGLATFWLEVHGELRQEAATLQATIADLRRGPGVLASTQPRLIHELRRFLVHLQTHHHVEDTVYFPRFRTLDPRLPVGFDLLEADHGILHHNLLLVAEQGQRLIASTAPDSNLAGLVEPFADAVDQLVRLLVRHLADEEDLIVPIVLHYGPDATID